MLRTRRASGKTLRLLAKDNLHFKNQRIKLRKLIKAYESDNWNEAASVSAQKLETSKRAEKTAEEERAFIENRKVEIRKKLKKFELTQEDLAYLLGHKSKTHMSELINGIKPFTHRDLVIISILFAIDIRKLVPVFLSENENLRIREALNKMDSPKIKKAALVLF